MFSFFILVIWKIECNVCLLDLPFFEHEKNCNYNEEKSNQMIPCQLVGFKYYNSKKNKHYERDNFLDHFQFKQIKRSAIACVTDAVCRHLEKIFKEGNSPADKNYSQHTKFGQRGNFMKLEMAIPGNSHETVCYDEQANG